MDHASPEEYEDHLSDGEVSLDDEQEHDVKQESSQTSPSSNATGKNAPAIKTPSHLQKRRRVTRACDECRRKKIKCDGKQPCTHCTVYSYDCTYDQPSNRRRNPAPQYVENLEHRVHRAETLLHILIPNLDLNDPGIDAAVAQGWIPGAPGKGNPTAAHRAHSLQPPAPAPNGSTAHTQNKSEVKLESMVRAIAQMDMDDQGHWDYHGHSSGLSFVRRMREHLPDLMGPDTVATPFVKTRPWSQVLESPRSAAGSPAGDSSPTGLELPPIEIARHVCSCAVDDAAALLRVVHKPCFWASFERLYSVPSDQYTNEDNTFLPLFHTVMALGHLFAKDEKSSLDEQGYEPAIQQGFVHFKAARQLMDIADCRDLTSIQAIVFMILFLQSSAKLSQCYAYVGVALRSALRMGLHRAYSAPGAFNPIESEIRKRVFWIVRKMDIYIGAMLGLPQTLSDDDIDQEFPLEVDDEYITKDGILPMPEGQVSLMAAFNAHTRLVLLVSKIVRLIYPIKAQQAAPDKTYSVPFSVIREIEGDLENWKNSLPPILSPCPAPARYTRIQQLLRLSYAHAQVMLYRPFLHFTREEKRSGPIDQRAYACGASYVNVSRNIIHITTHMKEKGLLNGAFWFIMYTTYFAIMSLVYFAAENPDNPTTQAVIKDAIEGRQTLKSLARRSMAADRTTATLDAVFSGLPPWMQDGQQNPVMTRKRQFQPSPQPQQRFTNPQGSRSHPDISAAGPGITTQGLNKRASTFPKNGVPLPISTSPSSYESPWSHSGTSSFGPQTPTTNGFDPQAFAQWSAQNATSAPQYPNPANFSNPALPDLSAMMFPTADEPFVYPNQPLTTFENNQESSKPYMNGQGYSGGERSGSLAATASGIGDDNLEAQFFALPPYIEQQRQQQHQQHMHRQQQQQQQGTGFAPHGMAYSNGQSMNNTPALHVPNGGWMQPDLSGMNINIQDLFGGTEWNPMMMNHPTYQNQ